MVDSIVTVNTTECKQKKHKRRNYDVQITLNTLQIISPKMTWHLWELLSKSLFIYICNQNIVRTQEGKQNTANEQCFSSMYTSNYHVWFSQAYHNINKLG